MYLFTSLFSHRYQIVLSKRVLRTGCYGCFGEHQLPGLSGMDLHKSPAGKACIFSHPAAERSLNAAFDGKRAAQQSNQLPCAGDLSQPAGRHHCTGAGDLLLRHFDCTGISCRHRMVRKKGKALRD